MKTAALPASVALLLFAPFAAAAGPDLEKQVADAERAFAKTMADRDFTAFQSFLAEEAVFFSGEQANRGRKAVAEAWKALYAKDKPAPFSWEPDNVQVLDSGKLAHSSGPVRDASGKVVGRFNSIWRLEAPNTWRVVFDKGCDVCQPCADKPPG